MKLTSEHKKELERLLAAGNKVEAVKQFRNIADVGLAEATAAINALEAGDAGATFRATAPRNLREAEQAALAAVREGNVIEAIKRYRQHTRLGLKESKDAVDILGMVHRTDGRVHAKLARSLVALVARGQKQEAVTQLMSQAGYDDDEARKFIGSMGGAPGLGKAGCVAVMLVAALVLAGIAAFLLLVR